ncbi:MAG: HlyD family efflux transporter periplasmic adaptor subunit [Pseudomonadota bacterium]
MKPLNEAQIQKILEAEPPARASKGRIFRFLIRGFIQAVLAVAVLAGGYKLSEHLIATKPEVAKRTPRERVYTVETVPVGRADHQETIRAFGRVVAAREVELRALVAGTIVDVHPALKSGAVIEAGAPLVTIDDFDYIGALTEARANLAEAEAGLIESRARSRLETDALRRAREQLIFAVRDQERVSQLRQRGRMTERDLDERDLLVSQRQEMVDQRENNLRIEEARIRQQEAVLDRLRWKVRDAERDLADTALRAPFRAVVLDETVEVGRALTVNDVVATLYEADSLEARFQLTDQQFGEILAEAGTVAERPVDIIWRVGDEPVQVPGRIIRAGAEITADRGGVEVIATIDAAAGAIRPGAFVEIVLSGRRHRAVAALPETAVYDSDHVFVVVDGRLQRRTVSVVGYGDGTVFVTGDISDADPVLATRIAEVGEGLKVQSEDSVAEPETVAGGN